MVGELDGQRFAQLLAATAIFFCPIYLTMDNFLSMNSFEPLFWTGCAAIAMRIVSGGPSRLWLPFGAVAGVGILNKHSMLFFGLAMLLGLLVSSGGCHLRNRWIWLGALLVLVIPPPNLLWEITHNLPDHGGSPEARENEKRRLAVVRLYRAAGAAGEPVGGPHLRGGPVVLLRDGGRDVTTASSAGRTSSSCWRC